jgi:NDP-sugar pyrophosphorylase family protein
VVLVGGFGTRLRPLTLSTPKQMLPIVNLPMIERVLAHLASYGIDDAVLALGYRADSFSDAYPDGTCAGVQLHYAVEPEPLDTAGAIRFAALDAGIDERFVVINSDVLTDLDVGALLRLHDERGAEGTIALHRVDDPSAYGVVPTLPDGRVEAFVEKPPRDEAPTDLINAGTYILEPSVIGRIDDGRRVSVERETFPAMVADGSLYAMDGATYWIDTGTPATYLQANLDLLDGLRGAPPEAIGAGADVHGEVTRSAIGQGATIGPRAKVRDSVVMAGAVVGAGASIERSIVAAGALVRDGAALRDLTVVGAGEVVDAGADLRGVLVPEPVA